MRKSVFVSIGIVTALGLWMFSGVVPAPTQDGLQVQRVKERSTQPMKVRVRESVADTVVRKVVAQGQLEPLRTVELRAETAGTVLQLAAAKGDKAAASQVLVQLSMENRAGQLSEAKAVVRLRQADLAAIRKLGEKGLQAGNRVLEAEAQYAAARAALETIRLDIEHTQIRAPFAGIVNERSVDLGDWVQRGDMVATLVDQSRLLATAQVPQHSVGSLRIGQEVAIKPISGPQMKGLITYISSVAESGTRSFRIEAEVANPENGPLAGMSAVLEIPVEELRGHFVSPALLVLNDAGEIGVKAVDQSARVVFHPVRVVSAQPGGAWVVGPPERFQLITLGQGFVAAGDTVEPSLELVSVQQTNNRS